MIGKFGKGLGVLGVGLCGASVALSQIVAPTAGEIGTAFTDKFYPAISDVLPIVAGILAIFFIIATIVRYLGGRKSRA